MISATNREAILPQLQAGVETLLTIAGDKLPHSSETDSRFSLSLEVDIDQLALCLADLAPFSDLFDISLEYQIQQGSGTAALCAEKLVITEWREDPDLNPPDLDLEPAGRFASLAERLAEVDQALDVAYMADNLEQLVRAGAEIDILLRLFVNKESIVRSLSWPAYVRCLFFISVDKFLCQIRERSLRESWDLLVPNRKSSSS